MRVKGLQPELMVRHCSAKQAKLSTILTVKSCRPSVVFNKSWIIIQRWITRNLVQNNIKSLQRERTSQYAWRSEQCWYALLEDTKVGSRWSHSLDKDLKNCVDVDNAWSTATVSAEAVLSNVHPAKSKFLFSKVELRATQSLVKCYVGLLILLKA